MSKPGLSAQRGFTLIELMIVVVVLGVLAAIALPNFVQMQNRAKEGSLKANMHTFQLAAEDYALQHDGIYANDGSLVVSLMPAAGANFRNPFSQGTGAGTAWEDRGSFVAPATALSGLTSYADSSAMSYNIRGYGRSAELTLVLSSGQ
jgi:prepilin-type N-terminal cleavage/methylation domain-containing protein